ncbi:MAG: zinc metallopeptidase [Bdellovibrionales bacterium]|nr:zinc metallopeptidase [Bdellovibrionales bacterium]
MFHFDPMYFLFLLPAIALAGWAQLRVRSTFNEAHQIAAASRLSGAQVAQQILAAEGISDVGIERAEGFLGDHYDPRHKVLRLSDDVYNGRSLAALGIAAHEVGHAVQHAQRYAPLVVRNAVVPMASFGSNASWFLLFLGAMMSSFNLILAGIFLYSTVVFFQLVNLPVEFDASSRARAILLRRGIVSPAEDKTVGKVLNAAAMTYVAATITAVLTLLYYLMRFGLLGDRER